jgi:sulfur-oxidizing protein SoxX
VRRAGTALCAATLLLGSALLDGAAQGGAGTEVVEDAMPRSLTGNAGDAARGREAAFSRERGNCIACHVIPSAEKTLHGDLGPSLKGVGDRLGDGQMRLRLVDSRQLNPRSIMPSYYRVDGLTRVAAAFACKPVLTAQEIEDVIAFLRTLREGSKK